MRQAVFSYKERNKNPSSCAPLYTNLYYIKTRNSLIKKKKKKQEKTHLENSKNIVLLLPFLSM